VRIKARLRAFIISISGMFLTELDWQQLRQQEFPQLIYIGVILEFVWNLILSICRIADATA
jgi:hypothetical protein